MRNPRFVHVGITYHQLPNFSVEHIQLVDAAISSEAIDWVRYAWNCYILWTASDCETISRKIHRLPGLNEPGHFVCEFSPVGAFGSLPPWIWEWIGRDRGYGAFTLTDKPLGFLGS
jgi:hypothetical protein